MTHYERDTYSLLNERMFEHATVKALLGIANEMGLRRQEVDINFRANLENVRRRTGEAPEPLRDPQGRVWPVTGYWCDACGMPLHRTLRAIGVHPACDNSLTGPQ